ncbi:TD and POZ domain-containing protein 3 [Caerostris darwini]|uniref:TD and POZ domain-containing protein 3 n=1 Tax=Caerostris darwini TaxID=1538125 RepID=A0AAV4SZV4_9ARAC|nr:TD and POZ domain-containing protein 3 [Caerostris darwini]
MGSNSSALKESEINHGTHKVYRFEYSWLVANFKTLATSQLPGSNIASDYLYLNAQSKSNTVFLMLYPHGFNERVKDYISLWLKKTSDGEILFQFTCALLNAKGEEIVKKSIKQRMSIECHIGWITFCRTDFILDDESKILKDGNLVLNCTLDIFEDRLITNAQAEEDVQHMNMSLVELSENFNQLLSGKFHDITLIVDGVKLPAHKSILSARSPVFKAMMNSALEAESMPVEISDISKEIVKLMLQYIYSGEVGYITVQTAMELYYAADKYELISLKEKCSKILVGNLEASCAVDILLLGHKHFDEELKFSTIKFIVKNASEVQKREEWVNLMKNYPHLANIVFKNMCKKGF